VIASQAVISGAYLHDASEAMSTRVLAAHGASCYTSVNEMSGQVFVPWVNYFLLIMVMLAVLGLPFVG
jgi:KUP system potassium uptake protein